MKKFATWILLIFAFGALCSFVFGGHNSYYEKYEKYKYGFFPYYSTIDTKISEKDKVKAEEILGEVEKVLEYTGEINGKQFGELTYLISEDSDKNIAKSDAEVRLITAKFSFGGAYIWGEYDCEKFDEKGSVVSTYYDKLFYLKLKKKNGEWSVSKLKQIP